MALSDRERRLLAEMEAALASDDPALQSTLAGDTQTLIRRAPGGILTGLALILLGIVALFAGLIAQITLIGVAGFAITLTGLLATLRSLSSRTTQSLTGQSRTRKARSPRGSLGDRLQERWDRRTFE